MGLDRRLTPANGRVADIALEGKVEAAQFLAPVARQIAVPVADLCAAPDGGRDRQLVWGAEVAVYELRAGWAFVQSRVDGYVGYVRAEYLGHGETATHRVIARASHAYEAPDFKAPDRHALSMGSALAVRQWRGDFAETDAGFVPRTHLKPIDFTARDPVDIAAELMGTPYLWGGNSAFGIDCSGLVQMAALACGIPCLGDSDMQAQTLGVAIAPGAPLQRNDVVFWRGHVALVVDARTVLHANSHHMATCYEDLGQVCARIKSEGNGDMILRRRLG